MPVVRVRCRPLIAVALVAIALAACSVDATVTIRMGDDGSGEVAVRVVLDHAAVRAVEVAGGSLADAVRLDDLTDAGWTVGTWQRAEGGGATITVTKPFARPEEVRGIVREISGSGGPYRRFSASRDASAFSTSLRVDGVVDLRSVDLDITDDAELVAALTNNRVDAGAVERRLVGEALAGLGLHARVELPGSTEQVDVAPGEREPVAAASDDTDTGRILLLGGGIVLAVVAIAVAVRGGRGRRPQPDGGTPVRSPAQ